MKKDIKSPEPFDKVRHILENQYQDITFERQSGQSTEELQLQFNEHRSANPDESRILTKAWLLNLLCRHARIASEPGDYFVGKIEHSNMLIKLRNQWGNEERIKEFGDNYPNGDGFYIAQLDSNSHICPDWKSLLDMGIKQIRDRAAGASGVYHAAVALVFDGIIELIKRFDQLQPELGLAPLAERPPKTLKEALQLSYIYHELIELDGIEVRSMGRFDLLYNKYYEKDIKDGRLTRESTKELLKYYWIKFFAKTMGKRFGKPFTFGPDAVAFTYTAFEAYHEMRTVDPKFHVRLSKSTPAAFQKIITECISDGCTGIVIVNNDAHIEILTQNGKSREDAEDYILIGCYEPAVMGKELNCSGAGSFNLAKPIEELIKTGNYDTFENFYDAYIDLLKDKLNETMNQIRRWEKLWSKINPAPLFSGPMESCFQRGLDTSQAGAKYNTSGICCTGLANAVDSLAVIRQLVYEEKRCGMSDMKQALEANWQGYEELRLEAVHRVPKWGNNIEQVDQLAVKISDFLGVAINHEPNARGGVFQAALYGIIVAAQQLGANTGALPDGRLAGTPLTMNTSATPGLDKNGITSLINSVTKINLKQFPNGTVLDIMLHPSVINGGRGIDTLISLIHSHFAKGGIAIQFNIFDRDILRKAQRQPEKYANLQVRVCGWNLRFIDLSPEEQDIFITMSEAV